MAQAGLAEVLQMIAGRLEQQATESHAVINRLNQGGVPRDEQGRSAIERRKDYLDFAAKRPTFERGRNRWNDFAKLFTKAKNDYAVTDEQAKNVLWGAIVGQSSRLVVASMDPEEGDFADMTFRQYLARMGEKFTPAAESLQMEAEYKSRKQGKSEDVQNYINAKYELFQLAHPNAQARDVAEFYKEATEGFLNRYVRDQMFSYEPANIEAFGNRAVTIVQVERRRIRIGDSDTRNMDGLIPVTKPVRESDRSEPMEVDSLRQWENEDVAEEEDYCECMALQEHGLKGPCYYCYRTGHLIRNCPRKSAGLPRATGGRGNEARGRGWRRGNPGPSRGRGQFPKSNPTSRGGFRGRGAGVHQVEESEEVDTNEPDYAEDEEENEVVNFLEELAL